MAASRLTMVLALLAVASTTAVAFQEQTAGSGAPAMPKAGQPAVSQPAPAKGGGAALNVPATPADSGKGGTEIRIPGLGKLGVIPKVDFGLELLYGASEPKASEPGRSQADDQQLMIRGRVPIGR